MAAEHAQNENVRLDEFDLSDHAGIICWHSRLGENVERYEHALFPHVPRAARILSVRVCR